uniref:Galactose-1-phosphate uridyl transferase N-terminal domain-containing protein n=1 Tax=Tetradesmus obliquus TaxID=3088 RepID=A0A383VL33_TETOB|eukprot:jgi/Sobl393_1/11406/SZX65891.1
MQLKTQFRSVFDLAQNYDSLSGHNARCLQRIFQITGKTASCRVGPELSAKYNVQQDNQQLVVSLTNRYTLEQTWFNKDRTQKPQTFTQSSEFLDSTDNGTKCDFCSWRLLTASDPGFGRIELPHAVTGSNLFKYAEPSHGVVLFKHHQPLQFSQEQLSDLLDASWLWFQASHQLQPAAGQPFLLWNCLPRAGASQYHGHAQVMLTEVPVPGITRLQQAAQSYQQHHAACYYADLLRAHAAAGLLRQLTIPATQTAAAAAAGDAAGDPAGGSSKAALQQQQHTAWAFASLSPYKDMELVVVGSHLACPAFQRLMHAALRTMIDGCGCMTFNAGVLNIDLDAAVPAGVGLERQFWSSSSSSGNGQDESASTGNGGSSMSLGSSSSSSLASSVSASDDSSSVRYHYYGAGGSSSSSSDAVAVPDDWPWGQRPPVMARLVSRGKLSSVASDFGCLEVFGGASIGHTDPFLVVQQLDEQMAVPV